MSATIHIPCKACGGSGHVAVAAKTCANPTCGREFAVQEGRAEKGQNRLVGVMYCSRNCGRAVAQRRYRERIKERLA